jgi:hypothetical protein
MNATDQTHYQSNQQSSLQTQHLQRQNLQTQNFQPTLPLDHHQYIRNYVNSRVNNEVYGMPHSYESNRAHEIMDYHIATALQEIYEYNQQKVYDIQYKHASELEENKGCSICTGEPFEDAEGGEEVEVAILNCDHTFHKQCIARWLNQSPTCPLCRLKIRVL